MTEKHYPYCGGSFDRIIFDKDGSVWVPDAENAKLRKALRDVLSNADDTVWVGNFETLADRMRELGIEVDV